MWWEITRDFCVLTYQVEQRGLSFERAAACQGPDENNQSPRPDEDVRGRSRKFRAQLQVFVQLNLHPYPDCQDNDARYL